MLILTSYLDDITELNLPQTGKSVFGVDRCNAASLDVVVAPIKHVAYLG
ncbi:MAG: hypothetical protein WB543_05585 [Candidatus Acidiferrum sp.]